MRKNYIKLMLWLCLLWFPTVAMAQSLTVSGTVKDEDGNSLPGVSILIKGTADGTVTDLNGKYTIEAPTDATLVFSFIGYGSQEETINGRTVIDVSMTVDATELEEIVVVGYGEQKKATLTGSVSSIKSDQLVQRPAANTTELLQGQVAGLMTRQSSGLPGADGTTLRIRGFGDPLVIIDGVVGVLAQVDPNDIESISVLKDASAAVYGARAGDGVILVTTKRGAKGPAKINYHGTMSFTKPTFLPDMVDATKWAIMLNESGLNPDNYMPNHLSYDAANQQITNTLDGSAFAGYDWAEELYRNWTPQQQHNLSVSGGTDKVKYFVSAGFTDQESAFKSGDYDFNRYNIRSNIQAEINEHFEVSMMFAYRSGVLDKANFGVDEMYNSLQTAKPAYPVIHEQDPSRATYSGFLQRSPYAQTFKDFSGYINNQENQMQSALEITYKLPWVKGLAAKARLNFEDIYSSDKTVRKPFSVWEYDEIKAANNEDPWIFNGTQNRNSMLVYTSKATELLPWFTLQYENTFSGDHHIKAAVINEVRRTKFSSLRGNRNDILSFEAPFLQFSSLEGIWNEEGSSQTGRVGIISRINYDFRDKYLFEFTMRTDASAEYPPEGRWGVFPSISAGWRLSDEAFISDNLNFVNDLKLRASYGVLGNDASSSFDYLAGYLITDNNYIFGETAAPIISSAGLPNPNITWTTMKISNVGLTGTLFDGALDFEVDAFYRLSENILAPPTQQVPSTFGADLPRTNQNSRDKRGVEVMLSHNRKIGEVNADISAMFTWNRGKFVDWVSDQYLPVTSDLNDSTRTANQMYNDRYTNSGQYDDRVWGYVTDGFFMNQEQIDAHSVNQDQVGNTNIDVGDLIYKDLNGDNYIDWRDQAIIAKGGLPNTMFSVNMGANYKGFTLRMLWQGGAGYSVNFGGSAAAPFANESIPLSQHWEYRAIVENDEITNPDDFQLPPVTQIGRSANNNKASDFWTYDAQFLRLKNLYFAYTIPQNIIQKAGFSNFTLYFSGANMLTLSNLGIWKKSFDPEVTGANNRDYPPVKTATFGVKLSL